MNMKKCINLFCVVVTLFCAGCGIQKKKQLGESYYKLALLDLEEGKEGRANYAHALMTIDKALAYREDPAYLALKATILFIMNHEVQAQRYFSQAINQCFSPALKTNIENNYACLLAQKGESDKAYSLWEGLLENEYYTTPEVALVNQGKCLIMKQRYDEALQKLTQACERAPNYVDAYYYRALIHYFQHRNRAKAQDLLTTVLALEPNHKGALQLSNLLQGNRGIPNQYCIDSEVA